MTLLRSILLAAALAMPVAASSLEIIIEPVFQGEPLRLDSLHDKSAAGETLPVTRLSYLLGGFALERDDGQWIEYPEAVAWMDTASRQNSIQLENLPGGNYRSIRFHIGPDAAGNAADVAKVPARHPLNPNLTRISLNTPLDHEPDYAPVFAAAFLKTLTTGEATTP